MRRLAVLAALGVAVVAFGCLPGCRRELVPDAPSPAVTSQKPTTAQLVAYMNENAQLLQSIKSTNLEIEATQGRETIGLGGTLFCEKPRDFRLRAKVAAQPAVDIGSNNDEFWFWISQGKDQDGVARVHYCSYQDMSAGKARMPFPFQPDMIVAALGLGEYGPDKEYSLKEEANTVSLVEKTVSAQGQPVQRVTVFNRTRVGAGQAAGARPRPARRQGQRDLPGVDHGCTDGPDRPGQGSRSGAREAGMAAAADPNGDVAVRYAGEQH